MTSHRDDDQFDVGQPSTLKSSNNGQLNRIDDNDDDSGTKSNQPRFENSARKNNDEQRQLSINSNTEESERGNDNETGEKKNNYLPARFKSYGMVGGGGYGSVFRVFDKKRGEMAALKILRNRDPIQLRNFKKEFRQIKELTHTNLVRMHELVLHNSQFMILMELVENGVSFTDYVRNRAVTSTAETLVAKDLEKAGGNKALSTPPVRVNPQLPNTVLSPERLPYLRRAIIGVVKGLMAIHERGQVHRDIKPQNVLVTPDGITKILDFGLVTTPKEKRKPKESNLEIAGTPEYMAPEQMEGDVAPSADFYCLGGMIYEALVGRLPFPGSSAMQILFNKKQNNPPDIREHEGLDETLRPMADLAMRLLSKNPSDRPTAEQILEELQGNSDDEPPSTDLRGSSRVNELIGRERELQELYLAFEEVKTSETSLMLLVSGHSGIGKTALLQRFVSVLDESNDVTILTGKCFDAETIPFEALDSVIDGLAEHLGSVGTWELAQLADVDVDQVVRVFPVLQDVWPNVRLSVPPPVSSGSPKLEAGEWETRGKAFSALTEIFAKVAAIKPMVVWVDDVQWGDIDSAMFFQALLTKSKNVLLILSFREEARERSLFINTLLEVTLDRHSQHSVRHMAIQPLHVEDAEDLAFRSLPDSLADSERFGLASQIVASVQGSPFFILELCRFAPHAQKQANTNNEIGRDVLQYAGMDARVSSLTPEGRRLLEFVCVAARATEFEVLDEASSLDAALVRALEELERQYLVQKQKSKEGLLIEPFHDRVRERLVSQMSEERVQQIHRKLANALVDQQSESFDAIAEHYRLAGDREKAWEYTLLAADRAASQLAFAHAASLYRQALDLFPDRDSIRLQRRLAEAYENAGFGTDAARLWRELVRFTDNPREARVLKARAGNQFLRSGLVTEGLSLFHDLLRDANLALTQNYKLAMLRLLWGRLALRLRGTKFRPNPSPDDEQVENIDLGWSVTMGLSNVDVIRAAELQTRLVRLALRVGEPLRVARSLCGEASFLCTRGPKQRPRVNRLIQQAREIPGALDDPSTRLFIHAASGLAGWFFGDWVMSKDNMGKVAIEAETVPGKRWEMTTARHYICWSLCRLGDLSRMKRLVQIWLPESLERNDLYSAAALRLFMSNQVWLMSDTPDKARGMALDALSSWKQEEYTAQHYYGWYALSQVDLYTGDIERALRETKRTVGQLRESLLDRIQTVRVEYLSVTAKLHLSALDQQLGDAAEHQRVLHKCAKLLTRERESYALAFSHFIRAALAHRGGNIEQAESLLRDAATEFRNRKMQLHERAIDWCRGHLIGGDEGQQAVKEAQLWLTGQGIVSPAKFMAMTVPGFENPAGKHSRPLLPRHSSSSSQR